jgi:hypothetical protein
VASHFKRVEAEQARLAKMGIKMNYVRPILFQGKRLWGLGSQIYYNRRPNETFHEFIVDVLRETLGKEWWELQDAAKDKHFIKQCFDAYYALKVREAVPEKQGRDGVWSASPDGPTTYLLALSWDVCSLIHAQALPQSLLNRLRHRDQFQGARYEIGIAAVFARLAFDVEFLDETAPPGTKHCEFNATDPSTGLVVAVEVKSRHRAGVLHQPGTVDYTKAQRGDVNKLLREAMAQSPGDKPFLVFVDLNAPLTGDAAAIENGWYRDLSRMLGKLPRPTPQTPTEATALYFTNFSYHYERNVGQGNELSEHIALMPRHRIDQPEFFVDLVKGLTYYGHVPSFDVDGVLGWSGEPA